MIFPFLAAIGAFLAANAVAIAFTFASMLYQRRRQKKLAAELDKQKGFDLVVDGEPINLPLTYGAQKIAGVRTIHKTFNNVKQRKNPANSGWVQFNYPLSSWPLDTDKDHSSSKNQYLLTQQALCFGGIDEFIDIEVNSQSWDKGKFSHMLEAHLDGGVDNISATASGIADTNKFTNAAWINAIFWLNRNDYNYQGVPNISAYVKGQRIWSLKENNGVISLDTKAYSNNNSYVLMDYLLRPRELGGVGLGNLNAQQWLAGDQPDLSRINLGSFYNAAQICDTTVETITGTARGRVNGVPPVDRRVKELSDRGNGKENGELVYVEDIKQIFEWSGGAWAELLADRTVKLYECNITIDTSRDFRDNIELLLETMGESEMTFSEGKYKLLLDYPENEVEQDQLIAMEIDDSYIVSEDVTVSYPGSADRLNRVTVKFKNEEHDFVMDSVSWPQWGDANHQKLMSEDNQVPSEQEIFFPGCSIRHLALAKAENMVRQSRIYVGDEIENPGSGHSLNQQIVSFTLDRRGIVLETGDLIKLNSEAAGISNRVFRIETLKYTNRMNVELTASQFNYTNLAYSSKDSVIPDPRTVYDNSVANVRNLAYNQGIRNGSPIDSNGYLNWNHPLDEEVRQYIISTSTNNVDWEQLGTTRRRFFDIPAEYDDGADRFFNVRVESTARIMNDGVTVFVNNLQTVAPISSFFGESRTNGANLNWSNPAADITRRYEVYWSKSATKPSTPNQVTRETYLEVTGLDGDTDYRFWVDAVGYSGTRGDMLTPIVVRPTSSEVDPDDVFGDPADPTNLQLSSTLDDDNGKANFSVSWTNPADMGYVAGFRVKITDVNAGETRIFDAPASPFERDYPRGVLLEATVESYNGAAKGGGYLTPQQHTTAADSVPPAVPQNLSGTGGFNTVWLEWSKVGDTDLAYYEVVKRTVGASAPGVNPSNVKQATDNSYAYLGLPDNHNRDYYVRAVDTSGNKSAWSTKVNVVTKDPALTGVTSDDIAGIVREDSFVLGLEPIKTVNTLPDPNGYTGSSVVLLTTDGKTYRYHNGAWTAEVPAVDISGQIQNNQINTVNAAKLTGTINEARIAGLAASKITGELTSDQIADLDAAKIAGQLTDSQLAGISAGKLVGNIVSSQIASIDSAKLTGTINEARIAGLAASKITGQLTDGQIASVATAKLTGEIVANQLAQGATLKDQPVFTMDQDSPYTITPANGSVSYDSTDKYSGTHAALITFTDASNPSGGGNTGAPFITIPDLVALRFGGKRIRISGYAKAPSTNAASEFGVAYSTSDNGNSGFQKFTPTSSWKEFSFTYDVPTPVAGGSDYLGFWADTSNSGKGTLFDQWSIEIIEDLGLASGQITETQISDDAISTPKLKANAVTASIIAANAVVADKIAANAVVADKIAANAITAGKIAANAVTASEIAAGAVTASEIAAGAVVADKIASNAITAEKIEAGAITAAKIAANTIGAGQIAANAITASELASNSIQSGHITSNAIVAAKIASNAITSVKINAGAVNADKLAANAVTAGKIDAGAVTAGKIASNAVTANKIAANAITAGKIDAGAVTTAKLAAGSVEASKIASGAVTTAKLAVGNGGNMIENSNWTAGLSTVANYSNDSTTFKNQHSWRIRPGSEGWSGGHGVLEIRQGGTASGTMNTYLHRMGGSSTYGWPCKPGAKYSASVQMSVHRCTARAVVVFRRADNSWIDAYDIGSNNGAQGSSEVIDDWPMVSNIVTAPTAARYAQLIIYKTGTNSGSDSYVFVHKPMLAETHAEATEATPYSPSGATLISGNEIMTGAITAEKIAANSISAVQIAANTIGVSELSANAVTSDKIAANAVSAGKIATNAISAGKIQAGAVSADKLAAKSITASKLAVGDFTNLNPDMDFADPDGWTGITRRIPTGVDWGGTTGVELDGASNTHKVATSKHIINFDPLGEKLRFEYRARNRLGNAGYVYADIQISKNPTFTGTNGTDYTFRSVGNTGNNYNAVDFAGDIDIPAGFIYGRIRLIKGNNGSTRAQFGVPRLYRKNAGKLIVDGSIKANHVGANEIIANTANIKNGVITNAKIANATIENVKIKDGTIENVKIKNSTITGSKIAGSTIAASNIKNSTITGGKIANATITGGNISTNTIEATHIKANTITGDKIKANTISADRLKIGVGGGNLLLNTDFSQDVVHWYLNKSGNIGSSGRYHIRPPGSWSGRDFPVLEVASSRDTTSSGYVEAQLRVQNPDGSWRRGVPVTGGKWYQASARINALRSKLLMEVRWYDDSGNQIDQDSVSDTNPFSSSSADPGSWRLYSKNWQAPSGAESAVICFRLTETTSNSDGYIFVHNPQLVEVDGSAVQYVPYGPGGTTTINGGSIRTGSITAGVGIFQNGLKSSNFNGAMTSSDITNYGTAGWAIASNGDAVFNNLVARSWVQVGAVSKGASYSGYSSAGKVDGDVVTRTTGPFSLGEFWQIAARIEYRTRKRTSIYYQGKGGSSYSRYRHRTRPYLEYREKNGGTWSGWTVLHQFPDSPTNDSWTTQEVVKSKMDSNQDTQIRIRVHVYAQNAGDSSNGWNDDWKNVRNVTLYSRALVR
ncbi:virion structural protein [Bacteriophage DSS3_VP1]|uniref:Host specificity protein J n=1 Tax=Bacteriophage DSS3_VP1 TaxID=2664196 RepID=A0A7S5KPF4_9CAUD|nr:virion structural protein [Bacteriophage DSS3_VP1]QGH74587.1 host specificity protein J [Bacteriophage DSS3_VP1]